MTLQDFSKIFTPLALQLRATDADEAMVRAYFIALKDVAPEFLAMAAQRLAKRGEWFPKTSEWLDCAQRIEAERLEEQRARLRKLPVPLCRACGDTGWELCDDNGVKPCACRRERRLEVLGLRPMPTLPEASL